MKINRTIERRKTNPIKPNFHCRHFGICSGVTFSHNPFFWLRAVASNCWYL
jgi:hypothetical protein